MNRYNVTIVNELGKTSNVEIDMPYLVDNVTEYVREELKSRLLFIVHREDSNRETL